MEAIASYAYIAFDLFPSQKGAATHINHCLKALESTYPCGLLICLGNDGMPAVQYDEDRKLYVYRWKEKVIHFLERTVKFQAFVSKILAMHSDLKLIHFRDIWGGIPALKTVEAIKKVYEVNAFASIELPSRYPQINTSTIAKIKKMEFHCIHSSDAIVTPSQVTSNYMLEHFNISEDKLNIIPNGVSIFPVHPPEKAAPFILYFGALQKWQGIKTLFKAIKELVDIDVRLMICTAVPEKRTRLYLDLAKSIGVASQVDWFYELDKTELAQKISDAKMTIAPLSACDRNIVQGCNPLKIIESMAYETPVVASDLPVCSAIITNNQDGFLVTPDRPEILGRKIRELLDHPEQLESAGIRGQELIEEKYLWERQEEKMKLLYLKLG